MELTYARRGIGLFFSARVFLGVGFANISTSFALKIARFDASPSLFIAVIIFSRTDLALASAPPGIDDGRLTDGAVAELVGIEGGVVSGVINLESSGVEASDWGPRHDEPYHEA